jgi:ParB family chromosome partitioning protein
MPRQARQALGKGLGALLGAADTANGSLRDIPLGEIVPNPFQPRVVFDSTELQQLASSIERQGVLQPITVRKRPEGGYELISGERRWRASKLAAQETVPALIRDADHAESLELALVENLQRKDLNPMESAHAYQRMINEFHLTQEQVATRVGKDRSSVANVVRLINLPVAVQDHIQADRLSLGHAKVLLSLGDRPDLQVAMAQRTIIEGLSVRQLEAAVGRQQAGPSRKPTKSLQAQDIEDRLNARLGTAVMVTEGKRTGRIEIRYRGDAQRDKLVKMLLDGATP